MIFHSFFYYNSWYKLKETSSYCINNGTITVSSTKCEED